MLANQWSSIYGNDLDHLAIEQLLVEGTRGICR